MDSQQAAVGGKSGLSENSHSSRHHAFNPIPLRHSFGKLSKILTVDLCSQAPGLTTGPATKSDYLPMYVSNKRLSRGVTGTLEHFTSSVESPQKMVVCRDPLDDLMYHCNCLCRTTRFICSPVDCKSSRVARHHALGSTRWSHHHVGNMEPAMQQCANISQILPNPSSPQPT